MGWVRDKIRLKRDHSGCEINRLVGRGVSGDQLVRKLLSSPGQETAWPKLSRIGAKNTDYVKR